MTHAASTFLLRILLVPIVAVWVYHLFQRRYRERGTRKRNASLYFTLVLVGAWVLVYFLSRSPLEDLFLVPIAFVALVVLIWQKNIIFPHRLHCARCGQPLSVARILFYDSNTCETCEPPLKEGETTP